MLRSVVSGYLGIFSWWRGSAPFARVNSRQRCLAGDWKEQHEREDRRENMISWQKMGGGSAIRSVAWRPKTI